MFLLACVVLVFWMFWGQGVCSRVFLVDPNSKAVSFINMVQFFWWENTNYQFYRTLLEIGGLKKEFTVWYMIPWWPTFFFANSCGCLRMCIDGCQSLGVVSGLQTFPGKKKTLVFFFHFFGKKKTLFSNFSEWVTPKLIPGKKKYGTFGVAPFNFPYFQVW